MSKKVLARPKVRVGVGNGGTPLTEPFGESVGANVLQPEPQSDMLASETSGSLSNTPTLTSGGEPKSVLLALIWSPLETLLASGDARIFVGKDAVAVFLHKTALSQQNGLVPADEVLAEL